MNRFRSNNTQTYQKYSHFHKVSITWCVSIHEPEDKKVFSFIKASDDKMPMTCLPDKFQLVLFPYVNPTL